MPTHVGLNLVYLVPGDIGGMEVVARELVPRLVEAAGPELRFTAFINREAAERRDGPWGQVLPAVVVPVHAKNRIGWVWGEQGPLPHIAGKRGVDLMHSLAGTSPAYGRFARLVTMHDLIYKIYPEAHSGLRQLGWSMLLPLAARTADRLTTDSESTRGDVMRFFQIPSSRIDVVPLGVGTEPRATPLPSESLRTAHEIPPGRQILLTVSAKRPHKNLLRLLDAVASIPVERRPVLIVPGYPTFHEQALRDHAASLGLGDDVRFLGWISPEELEGWYAACDLFVFPSLYEGFGMPVLEAMRRDVAVCCSDRSSLPEVAGDAVRYFDPEDPAAIASAVSELLADPGERERLIALGRSQVARFSWSATARGMLDSYERTLSGRRS